MTTEEIKDIRLFNSRCRIEENKREERRKRLRDAGFEPISQEERNRRISNIIRIGYWV